MKRMQHENSEIQKECNMKQKKYEKSTAQKKECGKEKVQHEKSAT